MVNDGNNFYNILGISANSNEAEIKKSYYKLAKMFHPDKNKQSDAEEKFKEINKAYEVLSDASKRRIYDSQNNFSFSGETQNTKAENQQDFSDKKSYNYQYTNYTDNTNNNTENKNKNQSFQEERFHEDYKKYFDSSFFKDESSKKSNKNTNRKPKTRPSTDKPRWNNNWSNNENSSYEDENDSFLFNSAKQDGFNDDPTTGFSFYPSDPFELLEAFAMYKLFSQMSGRLFQDTSDEDNFSKFMSFFNRNMGSTRPSANCTNSSQMNSKLPNLNRNKSNKNSWEFEWLGRKQNERQDTPLPSFCRADSDCDLQDKGSYFSKENAKFNNRYYGDGEDYEYDELYDLKDGSSFYSLPRKSFFECQYCNKFLNDSEAHQKHETICKRLSHANLKNKYYSTNFSSNDSSPNATFSNSPKSSSSILTTECPKCKMTMNTYDFLLHNCSKKPSNLNYNVKESAKNPPVHPQARNATNRSSTYFSSPLSASSTSQPVNKKSYDAKSDFVYSSKLNRSTFTPTDKKTPQESYQTPKFSARVNSTLKQTKPFNNENYPKTNALKNDYTTNQFYRSTPMNTFQSSMGFSSAKPYVSSKTPVYSKSRYTNTCNNAANGPNSMNYSYTGLKREKLRTGF